MRSLNFIRRFELAAVLAVVLGAAAVSAQDSIHAGFYKGTWKGATGDGQVSMTLKANAKSGFDAEMGLVIAGEPVTTKVISLKVSGATMEMRYEFEIQGTKLQSETKGTLKGETIEGSFKTSIPDAGPTPVDEGTWSMKFDCKCY